MGREFGYREGDLPVTDSLSYRLLRVPFYYEITSEEQDQVVDAVAEFLMSIEQRRRRRESLAT